MSGVHVVEVAQEEAAQAVELETLDHDAQVVAGGREARLVGSETVELAGEPADVSHLGEVEKVEAGIVGREIECAVLDGHGAAAPRASLPGEIVVAHDEGETQFYDFESKYQDTGTTQLSCPAELPEEEIERLRALAIRAFEAVDGSGLGRCDFFFTPDGRWVVNEINTMPGFTPISMYPAMWERTGLSYDDLISELLDLALERGVGLH